MRNKNLAEEDIKCPENVPEESKGVTEEERKWSNMPPNDRRVPRSVFAGLVIVVLAAFAIGGFIYYRANVLPEKYFQQATALMKQNDFAKAKELYMKILDITDKRTDVFYNIGVCCDELGLSGEAVEYYKKHLKDFKHDAKAMLRLGLTYMKSGEPANAYKWLSSAAKREKKNFGTWRDAAIAALSADLTTEAAEAFKRAAAAAKSRDELIFCGKQLHKIRDYAGALEIFNKVVKGEETSRDADILHGIAAARAMLGLPTDAKYTVVPAERLGLVELGTDKLTVKTALAAQPDMKEFSTISYNKMNAEKHVEIWTYYKNDPRRKIKIYFIGDIVHEVETASPLYKTNDGLCTANFLLPKYEKYVKSRTEISNGIVICQVKGGGITFYGHNLNESGDRAEEVSLRVHRGNVGIDNKDTQPLLKFK